MEHTSSQPPQQQKTSSPKMTSLPNEVLHLICSIVQAETLPNFRLACKIFAAVGAQHLFEEFHLKYCPIESFTKFKAISETDTLRQHVKSLLYQGDWLTIEDESKIANCRDPKQSCRTLIDGRHIDRTSARCIFLAAIDRLPNLTSVTLALAVPVRRNIHEERNRWIHRPQSEGVYRKRAPDQFEWLMNDLQAASLPLKCLRLGAFASMDFGMMTTFGHLLQLDLTLHRWIPHNHNRGLSQLLRSVPELRKLKLAFREDLVTCDRKISLDAFVDNFSMPHLTCVTITRIHLSDEKLLNFCRRHAQTLTRVRLETIDVTSTGSLEYFFEQMQCALNIEQIYITGEFRSTSGKIMILGPSSRQGRSTRISLESYLMKEDPSPFAVTGIEFGVSGMRVVNDVSTRDFVGEEMESGIADVTDDVTGVTEELMTLKDRSTRAKQERSLAWLKKASLWLTSRLRRLSQSIWKT